MRKILCLLAIPALLAVPNQAGAGELTLTIQNGLVTLIADDVPLSRVMSEWARIGKTTIVNGDKIMTPISLHIVDMPERKALDIVLRAASGYMVAQRASAMAAGSVYDRIMILPTSRPPANSGPIAASAPMYAPRPLQPRQPEPDGEEEDLNIVPIGVNPQPVNVVPGQSAPGVPGSSQPQGSLTAPRPGQLPQPAPQQQPVPFGSPTRPLPPGGGSVPGGPGGSGGSGGSGGPGGSGGQI